MLSEIDFNQKLNTDFSNSSDFRRRNPGKNNQNASKLIEKYTELAREALSNGDKILSENYLQHADHFGRIFEIFFERILIYIFNRFQWI